MSDDEFIGFVFNATSKALTTISVTLSELEALCEEISVTIYLFIALWLG